MKSLIKCEVLDDQGNGTGFFRIYPQETWNILINNGITNLRYVEHCHYQEVNINSTKPK